MEKRQNAIKIKGKKVRIHRMNSNGIVSERLVGEVENVYCNYIRINLGNYVECFHVNEILSKSAIIYIKHNNKWKQIVLKKLIDLRKVLV